MLAQDLGRLFEVGFNLGILSYLQESQLSHHFGNFYQQDLQQLQFSKILKRLIENHQYLSQQDREVITQWSSFFIQKGFFSGLNFFQEYIKSANWTHYQLKQLEILYYQCSFIQDNSIGTYPKDENKQYSEWFSQFGNQLDFKNFDRYIHQYARVGEFLKADLLMLLKCRQDWRILVVDLSVFSVKEAEDILPLNEMEVLRRILQREIHYLRSKSVFSRLRIDTGDRGDLDFILSKDLKLYFTAFKRDDKESVKLIQAGSYAYSFYRFLQETEILKGTESVLFNVVGYSDRGLCSICLHPENLDILATCSEIYKTRQTTQDIKNARVKVLAQIKRNAIHNFTNGKVFIEDLTTKPLNLSSHKPTEIIHQESIDNFFNSVGIIPETLANQLGVKPGLTLRNAHAELIDQALKSQDTYIFLTGNPGIGKTTAIANFLKSHVNEGFLFLYISPRKQVNIDIIEKFKTIDNCLWDDRMITLNTNTSVIVDNNGKFTVEYTSNCLAGDFTQRTVSFLDTQKDRPHRTFSQRDFQRLTEDRIKDKGQRSAGVLASLCKGIHAVLEEKISPCIIATVSIQSLRITKQTGKSTLSHLNEIFKGAFNSREGKVIAEKMQSISQNIKHIFIMIDEITGDDSGPEFLQGVSNFLHQYELTNPHYNFNTKVIIADASLINSEAIAHHLSETSPEPDKIYFRSAKSEESVPLSVQKIEFRRLPATVINANSYPASILHITYKVFIESCLFNEKDLKQSKNPLIKEIQSQMIGDLQQLLDTANFSQILVYLQDKRRLQEIITTLKKTRTSFAENLDYLEIHANLSEEDKHQIQSYKNKVQVVFMTSSASRGLSFPKAQMILIEIPQFQIERNLMEIIQVIYRARGEDEAGKTLDNGEKHLIFYLGDRAIFYPNQRQVSPAEYLAEQQLCIQESILNILNLLLILKASLMTRMLGIGKIGRKPFTIIPIGGKSVSAASQTFSGQITHLIRELKNEERRYPSHTVLTEVANNLEKLMGQAEFVLQQRKADSSYLTLRKDFHQKFFQALNQGFNQVLNLGKLEPAIVNGSLLIVPIDGSLEENYQLGLFEQIRRYATPDLLDKMKEISFNQRYPENLRTAIKSGIMEFVKLLNDQIETTQYFEEQSYGFDHYYTVPLFIFIAGDAIAQYFSKNPIEPEDIQFRTLLSRYIHTLYPAYNTLPIGRQYKEFPFLLFRSYSLSQIRQKIFTDNYLFNSQELNVLNLILSQET